MMVLITVLAVWLGWMAHRANQQKRAVAAIVGAGGEVYYDWEDVGLFGLSISHNIYPHRTVKGSPFYTAFPEPPWLRESFGDDLFHSVTVVEIAAKTLDDSMIETLQLLPKLEAIAVKADSDDKAMVARLNKLFPKVTVYWNTPVIFEVYDIIGPSPALLDTYSTDLLVD